MTTLEVWNFALGQIPHDKRVKSVDENSTEALRCRDNWEVARRKVLGAHAWTFAVDELACEGAMLRTARGARWRYPKPAGALRSLGLFWDDAGRSDLLFRARGGMRQLPALGLGGALSAREPRAIILFIRDIEDVVEFPEDVAEAAGWELAALVCPLMSGGADGAARLEARAALALQTAIGHDADTVEDSGSDGMEFVRARD